MFITPNITFALTLFVTNVCFRAIIAAHKQHVILDRFNQEPERNQHRIVKRIRNYVNTFTDTFVQFNRLTSGVFDAAEFAIKTLTELTEEAQKNMDKMNAQLKSLTKTDKQFKAEDSLAPFDAEEDDLDMDRLDDLDLDSLY